MNIPKKDLKCSLKVEDLGTTNGLPLPNEFMFDFDENGDNAIAEIPNQTIETIKTLSSQGKDFNEILETIAGLEEIDTTIYFGYGKTPEQKKRLKEILKLIKNHS